MKNNAMKKLFLSLILLTLCVALPALALADAADLTVRGTAVVSINPDFATLTLGYYAENKDLMVAQAETANTVDGIIAAVTALGVEKQDIITSSFSIGPTYNYNTEPSTITGYRVENMLTITVKDIQQVAAVMNAALKAGANQSYGITFDSTERGEAYRQALKEAIAVAKLKAEAMAEAAGLSLGSLKELSEVQEYYYAPSPMANVRLESASADKALGDTIMSGALQVTAQVEMQFELGK